MAKNTDAILPEKHKQDSCDCSNLSNPKKEHPLDEVRTEGVHFDPQLVYAMIDSGDLFTQTALKRFTNKLYNVGFLVTLQLIDHLNLLHRVFRAVPWAR